jgi:hypothetical protein
MSETFSGSLKYLKVARTFLCGRLSKIELIDTSERMKRAFFMALSVLDVSISVEIEKKAMNGIEAAIPLRIFLDTLRE